MSDAPSPPIPRFLRMTEAQMELLRSSLLKPCLREHKVYAFLGLTPGGLTVSRIWIPSDAEYALRTPVRVVMEEDAMMGFLLRYEDSGVAGVLELHSHPFQDEAHFSCVDDRWIGRVREAFDRRNPCGVFVRGVTGWKEDGFSLEVWNRERGAWGRIDEIRLVGSHGHRKLVSFSAGAKARHRGAPSLEEGREASPLDDPSWVETYQRTALIRSVEENLRIGGAEVVIVGLGGIGWEVAMGLAAIGVRKMTLIDADKIERLNLNRLLGATPVDAAEGRSKVDRMGRILRAHDPARLVRCIEQAFPGPDSVAAVQSADLVLTCVDRTKVRHDVLRLCVRHHVPAIDCGTSISLTADRSRERRRDGHVWLFEPGSRCCWHQMGLGGKELWDETLQEVQREAGYVLGAEDGQSPGSVQTINKATAAAALSLAEAFLAGRAPERNMILLHQSTHPGFDLSVRAVSAVPDPRCPLCGDEGFEGEGGDPFLARYPEQGEEGEPLDLPPLPEPLAADDQRAGHGLRHPWESEELSVAASPCDEAAAD